MTMRSAESWMPEMDRCEHDEIVAFIRDIQHDALEAAAQAASAARYSYGNEGQADACHDAILALIPKETP